MSDRIMSLKLETEGVMLSIVSMYPTQAGCQKKSRSKLDEVIKSAARGESVVFRADFHAHVG